MSVHSKTCSLVQYPGASVSAVVSEVIKIAENDLSDREHPEVLFEFNVLGVISFEPINLRTIDQVSPRMVFGMGISWMLDGWWVRYRTASGGKDKGVLRRIFNPLAGNPSFRVEVDLGAMSNEDVLIFYHSLTRFPISKKQVRTMLVPYVKTKPLYE